MPSARITLSLTCLLCALQALAQERGQWILGSAGLECGSQPPPGVYYSELLTFYSADKLETTNGQGVPINGSLSLVIDQITLGWVSNFKIFNGNYGFDLQPSISQGNLELNSGNIHPATGFGDLNTEPIILGWSPDRFDILASLVLVLPTGKYGYGSLEDTGRGQWTLMPSVGSTFYFDEQKRFSVSARTLVELPLTDRRNTTYRQGPFLDLEYSVGASLMQGLLQCGIVGYAGYQLSSGSGSDSGGNLDGLLTRIHALGPQVGVNIHLRSDVELNLCIRDYFEFAAQATTQGNSLFSGATLKF